MARAAAGVGVYKSLASFAREEKSYVASVLAHVRAHGPSGVSDIPDSGKRSGHWWGWSKGKLALETLFAQVGEVKDVFLPTARKD